MSETHETHRELAVNKSADEVWEWISNISNVMTANQFHVGLDCDPADIRDPRPGLDVPIVHEIFGARHIRLAKITKYVDYEIAWGERLPDPNADDRFPHSEGWKVESTGSSTCIIRNRLRGRHLFPLADVFGKELWDLLIPPILDNDLQDVAFAVGAIERKQPVQLPPLAGVLQRLSRAREINGVPAGEFFTSSG
jgi:hypothetical protein